jgi:hypothetical protein
MLEILGSAGGHALGWRPLARGTTDGGAPAESVVKIPSVDNRVTGHPAAVADPLTGATATAVVPMDTEAARKSGPPF